MNRFHRRSVLTAGAALLGATTLARAQGHARQIPAGPLRSTKTRFAANIEMWWGKLPYPDRIRAAHEQGFSAFEIWPWRGKDLDAILAAMAQTGMICTQFTGWGFVPGMNDPANHDKLEQEIKDGCAAAKKLGTKMMCVVAGNDIPGKSQAEMHDTVIAGLKRVAKIAEDNDITLLLEPMNIRVDHKGHCLYGSEAGVRICRAVGSPFVKVLWDLYHMQLSEGDLCGHLKDGFDCLGYAQMADTPGRHEPGTGEVNYARVLKQLHELGYRGFVGMECWPLVDEETAAKRIAEADSW